MKLKIILALACQPVVLFAADYYVSAGGSDANSGLSQDSAWQTMAQANTANLQPGDRLLFEGGSVFDGQLTFGAKSGGDAAHPIEITSYGNGRATLRTTSGNALYFENTAGFKISNLEIAGILCPPARGAGSCTRSTGSGIYFLNKLDGDTKLDGIGVTNTEIHGFAAAPDSPGSSTSSGPDGVGILIQSLSGNSGFKNVQIDGVKTYDNLRAGIVVQGAYLGRGNQNVNILNSESYDNSGIPNLQFHTGSGIALSEIEGGTIQTSYAHDNGKLSDSAGGPVGIWAYDSDLVTISENTAIGNWTRGVSDGGGFDFDGGVSNSLIERNYSAMNAGPGFLFAQAKGAAAFTGNTIRFNKSVNDARNTYTGSLVVWGEVNNSDVHDNVFISSRSAEGYSAPAMNFIEWTGTGVAVHDNQFIVHNGLLAFNFALGPQAVLNPDAALLINRNAYAICKGDFVAYYDDRDHQVGFNSLDDWRAFHVAQMQFEPDPPKTFTGDDLTQICAANPPELDESR